MTTYDWLIIAAVAVCLAQVALVPAARWHSVAAAAGAVSSGPL